MKKVFSISKRKKSRYLKKNLIQAVFSILVIFLALFILSRGIDNWALDTALIVPSCFLVSLFFKSIKYKNLNYKIGTDSEGITKFINNSSVITLKWQKLVKCDYDELSEQIILFSENKSSKITLDLQISDFKELILEIAIYAEKIQEDLIIYFDLKLPDEEISCLKCGQLIKDDETKCLSCQWTYLAS